ncbi:hypothetical protein BOX15_Mlig030012g2 [Macrostomum lignano]|uniref:Replication factor C subunit 3 n=2 Tax=Macrostomum lignano TaxID=282301 RepID=A0A1I8GLJ0_9PLAT|nr:hypothetical protein BOX15_Mlig002688g2 [Macrostomum lignano]PAA65323.1 hypothetical protein BOX15_Mlig030012g2 [Macrostomum lignano]
MSLWVDKYRPKRLDKLDYHTDQADRLRALVESGDFPHLLVYGPPGAGKKTRIHALLRELYGAGVERLRLEQQSFTAPSKRKVEIETVSSNFHLEVSPGDAGIYDRVVVMELIKQVASVNQLDASQQREFKVVVLNEVDRLTKDAQHALRRTMEKYMATCRLILCANSTSKVIQAIRSRCLAVRVSAPTEDEIVQVLQGTCRKEGLSLPDSLARRIAQASERNLRRALLMAEACRAQQQPFDPDQSVCLGDWQLYLKETAKKVLEEQSPARLLIVRTRLYELLSHCVPPDLIMRCLVTELISSCDGTLKAEVLTLGAEYEHRMRLGQKAIFHLEAFVARFMAVYKKFMDEVIMADW